MTFHVEVFTVRLFNYEKVYNLISFTYLI